MITSTEPSPTNGHKMDLAVPTAHSKKSSSGNRFQRLWDNAEKAREANRLFEKSLEALVIQVRNEIGPHELDFGLALRRQVFQLITFSSRKSLLLWQRGILEEWIAESMSSLEQFGLVDTELLDHFAGAQAQAHNIPIDKNSDISVADQFADALDEQRRNIDQEQDYDFDEEAFNFADWYDDEVMATKSGPDCGQQEPSVGDDENILQESNTFFKTLFHRTARALHPDKVTDHDEQIAKQKLMTKLLEARRNQDLMGVIELYREHVDSDAEFSEQDLAELERILHRFIELQLRKRTDLISQSPTHQAAYELFYSKSAAATRRKIKHHIKDIQGRTVDLDTFTESVRSLKALKPYLDARYDEVCEYLSLGNSNRW